jgi:hypothetical protein
MPLSRYDRFFGGNAAKAYREMTRKYGASRGARIFYATLNRKKRK